MKKALIKSALIMIVMTGCGLTALAQLGGYKPADVDSEDVKEAAEFAVSKRAEEHSEQEGLELDSIKKAERQSAAGINYRLCLSVSLDDNSQDVKVVVYQSLKKEYTLRSWEVAECGESELNESGPVNFWQLQKISYTPFYQTAAAFR